MHSNEKNEVKRRKKNEISKMENERQKKNVFILLDVNVSEDNFYGAVNNIVCIFYLTRCLIAHFFRSSFVIHFFHINAFMRSHIDWAKYSFFFLHNSSPLCRFFLLLVYCACNYFSILLKTWWFAAIFFFCFSFCAELNEPINSLHIFCND